MIYENIQLLREVLKLQPNNYNLLFELVSQLSFCDRDSSGNDLSEEELTQNRIEAIETGKRILARCSDPHITNAVIRDMSYTYKRLGENEKAIEYTKKLTNIWSSSTAVLGDI